MTRSTRPTCAWTSRNSRHWTVHARGPGRDWRLWAGSNSHYRRRRCNRLWTALGSRRGPRNTHRTKQECDCRHPTPRLTRGVPSPSFTQSLSHSLDEPRGVVLYLVLTSDRRRGSWTRSSTRRDLTQSDAPDLSLLSTTNLSPASRGTEKENTTPSTHFPPRYERPRSLAPGGNLDYRK